MEECKIRAVPKVSSIEGLEESKIQVFDTHVPSLEELVSVLQDGLKSHFSDVNVELVDCPDFSQRPYKIPVGGLHGKPAIVDIGGGELIKPLRLSS